MKRLLPAFTLVSIVLSGCGTSQEQAPQRETSSAVTSVASSTTSSKAASQTPTSTSEVATAAVLTSNEVPSSSIAVIPQSESVSEPVFSSPGVGYKCGGTDAWVYDPANCTAANLGGEAVYDILWGPDAAQTADEVYQDLSQIPMADGGTCPAALCGYGHDAYGNPNPSSGEIQKWWMDCIALNTDAYCRENDPYR